MRVRVVSDAGGLHALKSSWEDLLASSTAHSIFQTWEWQTAWWDSFGVGKELRLLTVSDPHDRLVGIAPFYLEESQPDGTLIKFVGGTDVSDYLDIVAVNGYQGEVWDSVLNYLWASESHPVTLDLHCLRQSSAICQNMSGFAAARGLAFDLSVENRCPVISLPREWEAYLATLSKKDRHELRRKIRRLEREAGNSLLKVASNASRLENDVDDFLDLHRKSDPDKAEFMDPAMRSFFQKIARFFFDRGWLRLCFLEVDGVRAASLMCFDYGGDLSVYNSGYDPAYSSLSVGIVLFGLCIKDAIERGSERFDFLRGTEQYKYDLGGRDREIYQLIVGDPHLSESEDGSTAGARVDPAGCASDPALKGDNA